MTDLITQDEKDGHVWQTDVMRLEQAQAILKELRHHIDMANTCLERSANAGIEVVITSGYNRIPGIAREVELMEISLRKFAMVLK